MVYLVYLKGKDDPVKIEADKFVIDDGVYQFHKEGGGGSIAGIPVSNVLSVVKE